jgi:hypothetical protein
MLDSWWEAAAGLAAGAALVVAGVVETRRHFRDQPGEPAVYINGRAPRLGPPTALCARNRHYRCDGRSRVSESLTVQCGCTCHIPG